MACLLRKQLHCLQASQLVLMNEIPEFRSAGLFIRGINLPRLCKGRTIQSVNSVTSVFFFLNSFRGALWAWRCVRKEARKELPSQEKKQTRLREESLLQNLLRAAICKACILCQCPEHTFTCNGRAEDRKRSSVLVDLFFFWHKAFPFSPRQKHIAAFRLPGEKRVSKRKWGVAVGCCTKHLCPVCRRCHLDAVASSEFSSLIRKTVSSQSTPFAFLMEMTFSLDTKQDIL